MSDTTSDVGSIYRQELARRGAQLTPANLQQLIMATRRGDVQIPGLTVQGVDPSMAQPSSVGSSAPLPRPPMPPPIGAPGASPSNVENTSSDVSPSSRTNISVPPTGGVSPTPAAGPTDSIGQLSNLATSILGRMNDAVPAWAKDNVVSQAMQSMLMPSSPAPSGPPAPSPGAVLGAQDTRFTASPDTIVMGPTNNASELPSPNQPPGVYVGAGAPGVPQLPPGPPGQPSRPGFGQAGAATPGAQPDSGSVAQSILTQLGVAAPAVAAVMGGRALMNRTPAEPPPIRAVPNAPPPRPEPQRSGYVGPSQQDRVLRAAPGPQQGPPTAPVSTAETPAQRAMAMEASRRAQQLANEQAMAAQGAQQASRPVPIQSGPPPARQSTEETPAQRAAARDAEQRAQALRNQQLMDQQAARNAERDQARRPPPSDATGADSPSYKAEHQQVMEELDKASPPRVSPEVRAATRRANRVRLPR